MLSHQLPYFFPILQELTDARQKGILELRLRGALPISYPLHRRLHGRVAPGRLPRNVHGMILVLIAISARVAHLRQGDRRSGLHVGNVRRRMSSVPEEAKSKVGDGEAAEDGGENEDLSRARHVNVHVR